MVKRSLGVALWSLVGLLACFLGALDALVGTHAGRTLLARVGSAAIQSAVSGTIEVGEVRGSVLTGVVLTDVRLFDPDSTLVAWLPHAELGYNLIDFAAGRIVFMEVRLDRPVINIVQHANGKTNFAELLRLDVKDTIKVVPLGPAGPRSLILLRNVQIDDGSLTLRLQKHGNAGANEEVESSGEDGRYRIRRFERLNARLAALRIQAPRERGIRIDVLRLATESSDPRLSIADGRLTGHVTACNAADSGLVALRQGDLQAHDLSLELARPYLDTLPFAGRLTGQTIVDGPMSALKIETGWSFRDSMVVGWPETQIQGKGEINLSGHELAFQPFAVAAGRIDVGTVRRLVPSFDLQGELDATGTLTGTLKNANFSGTLRHHDGNRPVSVIRGVVALDSRTPILGVFADVHADSLALDGLTGRIRNFPLRGSLAGTIRLDGSLAGLETHADLAMLGGGGSIRGDGTLLLGEPTTRPVYGVRAFTVRGTDVSLQRWLVHNENIPPTRLTFTATGSVEGDTLTPPHGAMSVSVAPSLFAGTVVDSGGGSVRFADNRLYVDSLRLLQPGLLTEGRGSPGLSRPKRGTLVFNFDADSLSVLDSLATWLAGKALSGPTPDEALKGSAKLRLTLDGALASMSLGADAQVADLRWRGWLMPKGEGSILFQPGPVPRFELNAHIDSLGYGSLGFGAAAARAKGTRDSLTWFARSRVGDLGAFLAGGRYDRPAVGSLQHVAFDSLALLLPSGVWFLEHPTAVSLSDSMLRGDSASLVNANGSHRGRPSLPRGL